MSRERIEVIDGREFTVTTLPKDERLYPSKVKRRTLEQAAAHRDMQRGAYYGRFKKRKRRRKRTKK